MIQSLHIENIAVVKSLDIDFSFGMTVLSGETGAGKSIIIDSLGLLLGAKADRELIRNGESRALVSALFSDIGEGAVQKLAEMGFETEDGTVEISRVIGNGAAVRFNGRAVTVAMLRDIGGMLFNIHGQNDNRQLLDPKNHIGLLDRFADNTELVTEYGMLYREILHIRCEIDSIRNDEMERARLGEVLKFQISDIDSAKLRDGEEEALEELVKRLSDTEKINRACGLADKAIRGTEKMKGASYLVERAAGALESVLDSVSEAQGLAERLANIKYELDDIAECVCGLSEFGDGDPSARLDKAQSRLNTVAKLKRKYGATVAEILAFRDDAANRLNALENAEDRLAELEEELEKKEEAAKKIALTLRERRKASAKMLDERVCDTLTFLDMPKVRFEVGITPIKDFCAFGLDNVEFLIATNSGEPLMPMHKIASGGELARIMLSLKNVLNECDGVRTVIFDEIDAGISGKTSRKVGIKLKEISRAAQVLCVTHSAQIASLAHNHIKIYKTENGGRVSTSLEVLDREGRISEISRILGGIEITEAVRNAAEEMIAEGESYI